MYFNVYFAYIFCTRNIRVMKCGGMWSPCFEAVIKDNTNKVDLTWKIVNMCNYFFHDDWIRNSPCQNVHSNSEPYAERCQQAVGALVNGPHTHYHGEKQGHDHLRNRGPANLAFPLHHVECCSRRVVKVLHRRDRLDTEKEW